MAVTDVGAFVGDSIEPRQFQAEYLVLQFTKMLFIKI